jgi:trans-aconitate 2-methyltransferase
MSNPWNPAQYEKFKAQRSKPFFDLASLIQGDGFASAVDLGCGTGELTKKLFERLHAKKLVGLDSSKEMLEKSSSFTAPGLTFELGDIAVYEPSAPLDLLFSNAALHWVPDHQSLFPKLLGFVAPGGQVAIQMPHNFDHPSHRIAKSSAVRLFPSVFSADEDISGTLSVEQYAEILFKAGFEEQVCRVEVYGHPMPSGNEVVEWTKGSLLTAYQDRLGAEHFAKFLELYRRELLAEIGEGPYFYAFKRLLLWGRRT